MLGDRHGHGKNGKGRCRGGASGCQRNRITLETWNVCTYVRRVSQMDAALCRRAARCTTDEPNDGIASVQTHRKIMFRFRSARWTGATMLAFSDNKSPQKSYLDPSSLRQGNILPFARNTVMGRQLTNGELSRLLRRPEANVSVWVNCQAQAHLFMLLRAREWMSLVHFQAINGIVTAHCSTKETIRWLVVATVNGKPHALAI